MSPTTVIARIDELLAPLEFVRHKSTWNRQRASFVDVIDVQTNKAGDAVTMNVGVLHSEIHRTCWGTRPPTIVEEPSCTVRARVGQLIDDKDLWWPLNDRRILDDISEKTTTFALPFLERMHSLEAMKEFLTTTQVTKHKYPPPIIYLAILMNLLEDREGGCELLAELGGNTVGAWKLRIREVAERLMCC